MEEERYELPIPPGITMDIIYEILEIFDLELIFKDKEERRGMTLVGRKEEVEKARKFIYEKQKEWIEHLEKKYAGERRV